MCKTGTKFYCVSLCIGLLNVISSASTFRSSYTRVR